MKELFAEVGEDYLYFPYTKDEQAGTVQGPKGFFYDHYKVLLRNLKEAGFIAHSNICERTKITLSKTGKKDNQFIIQIELFCGQI